MSASQRLIAERYRLLHSLGFGGMGRVWLARDEVLRREVAVKEVVFPDGLTDEERDDLCLRTLREARAAGRLSHPNVVQIYDVVETEGRPWIVMEFVRSRSLYQVIKQDGPLPPRRVAEIGLFLIDALRAAHQAGVLHRDVKPGNVLLAEDGRVVLTDFGLATFDGDGTVTHGGLILGSAQYIAPERARHGASGPETDMWSLGATLYAAVEGRSPYARESSMATLTALATDPPDPPHRAGPLKPVLIGLLRKTPRARLDADEAEKLLRRVAANDSKGRSRSPGRLWHPGIQPGSVATASPFGLPEGPAADKAGVAGLNGSAVGVGAGPGPVGPGLPPPRTIPDAPYRRYSRGPRRRWPWLVGVLTVAGLLIPVVALALDTQREPPSGQPAPNGTPTLAVTAAMGPQACVPQAGEQPVPTAEPLLPGELGLFPGRVYHRDPTGFRISTFSGWQLSRVGSLVCFREPRGVRVLAVDQQNRTVSDPVAETERLEQAWRRAAGLVDYKRLSLKAKPYTGPAAELEYTYLDASGDRMHGINLYVATPNRLYSIYWLAGDGDWPAQLDNYRNLTIAFEPAH